VVFGDEGVYLLGVVTLEELGLEVDPVKGELRPMELLLMQATPSTPKLQALSSPRSSDAVRED